MGHQEHERLAAAEAPARIPCAVLTISDTRSPDTDSSGAAIRTALTQAGHDVVRYSLVRDEPAQIAALVREAAAGGCKLIVTNGGTGIARRDSTFEAIDGLLEKRLPGFGELFRMLSYQEIGPAAMLSRATAGVYGGALIFCLPGSTNAVSLAMERLIVPQLAHLVWETVRQ
jgi:molybdenum cofactor biosynthesis protein B